MIADWSSISKPGRAYSSYVGYVRRACRYLEIPLSWDTPAVANCVAGLKLQGKGKFRAPNFIRVDSIAKIIALGTRDGVFAQLSFMSFLYALRAPSEALKLRRAYEDDDLAGQAPMKDLALIGTRCETHCECLVIRFARRKNLPSGCILSRPCFCNLASTKAKKLRPVHVIWPAIAARVRPGGKLFPGFSDQNANAQIRDVLKKLEAPSAQSYTSHGYRWVAAQELKEKGIAMAQCGIGWRMAQLSLHGIRGHSH